MYTPPSTLSMRILGTRPHLRPHPSWPASTPTRWSSGSLGPLARGRGEKLTVGNDMVEKLTMCNGSFNRLSGCFDSCEQQPIIPQEISV
ncbi:hypothetical protein CDL15_Pgr003297 [Punica granatum]|uniref:Uncharacterized protein n=1 Tax=Punica granatum TaxID=22663 RepID=A0A218X328_PUNGR|nr:hypothetical protein CDL15_Pgr003297 [Punica granatum]